MKPKMESSHTCPCCGFKGLEYPAYEYLGADPVPSELSPPYAQYFGSPSYEVCACCGFEFGNDDEPGTANPVSFSEYLNDWIKDGSIWFDGSRRPKDWVLENQLSEAGIKRPPLDLQ